MEEVDGIRVVRLKTFIAPNAGRVLRILDFLSFMVSAFLAGLAEKRPDVVAATTPQFFAGVAGCALAMIRRLPFVLEVSDLWPDSIVAVGAMKRNAGLRLLEKVELFLYRRAERIVALTGAFKRNLIGRGIDPDKIGVVINGVDLRRYQPRPRDEAFAAKCGIADGDFVVGYIGTHGMAHALESVRDAAELVEREDIRFLFVGAGAERERLAAEAARRGLGNVTFVPAQPKEAMPAVSSVCDIALVHLKDTPLFRTVIPIEDFRSYGDGEAGAARCPDGEASRIVKHENNGLYVPAQRPQELAAAVLFLKESPQFVRQLAERSLGAAPRYSRERQAREMLSVLRAASGAVSEDRTGVAAGV